MLRSADWPLITDYSGSIGCPEMSATSYQYIMRYIPEEQRYHLHAAEA